MLEVTLDQPLPNTLPAGQATAVFCIGTCFHQHMRVVELTITVDGARSRPAAQRMPRLDRFRELHPNLALEQAASVKLDPQSVLDPELRSFRSGFWAMVPLAPCERAGELEVRAEARLADGTAASAPLGTIAIVEPRTRASYDGVKRASAKPLIAICMATYNPDMELFRIQVDSLRAQTDEDWLCFISDDCSAPERFEAITAVLAGDDRFVLSRAEEHLSFYRNFERALEMVPSEIELVALCDQDDRWYPQKLATLRRAIGSASAELAYSDLRRLDAEGNVRAASLWQGRRNNRTNLASLLISNTIPGAACLFRRRVVEHALPFPAGPGWDFHDHWLAVVAMALGELAYVDRPLYDYIQHPGAVLGRVVAKPASSARRRGLRARLPEWRGFLDRWRSAYFSMYLERALLAEVLLARCERELTPRKRRALRLVARAADSPLAFVWLAGRPARSLFGSNETLGVEGVLVRGILWRFLISLRTWRQERPGRATDDASFPPFAPQHLGRRQQRWLARQ
jgi:glycosyltransferase involved in cell wall biosynthesis